MFLCLCLFLVLMKGGTNLDVGVLWPIQAISAISVLFVCLFLVLIKGGTNLNVGVLWPIQAISAISVTEGPWTMQQMSWNTHLHFLNCQIFS